LRRLQKKHGKADGGRDRGWGKNLRALVCTSHAIHALEGGVAWLNPIAARPRAPQRWRCPRCRQQQRALFELEWLVLRSRRWSPNQRSNSDYRTRFAAAL